MKTNKELVEDIYPMSDIQLGMVFTTMQNPERAIYHDQFTYYTPRVKDEARFETAVKLMMDIHPILRTGFDFENYSKQVQIVYKQVTPILDFEDLTPLTVEMQEEYIRDFMQKDRYKPYDFKKAPLWRINVFHLSEIDSLYLIQFHHAIMDGWSMALFNTQLFNIYGELQKDDHYKPIALQAKVKDAIVEEIAEKNNDKTIQFWKEKLEDYAKLNIFTKKAIFNEYRKFLDRDVTQKLKNNVLDPEVSYKNVVYGALMYVLKVFSAEDNFVCGIVSNTRPVIKDGDKILGCFLNTLPMRLAFKDYQELSWRDYFKVIEEEMRVLKTKDRSTLYEISKISGRKMGAENPFFDILFNHVDFYNVYKNLSISSSDAKSLKKKKNIKLRSYEATNTFLDLNLVDIPDGSLELHYKSTRELMPGFSLERLQECLDQVLFAYVNTPDAKMSDISFLSEEERALIFDKFNGTDVVYEKGKTVAELFRTQVLRFPDQTAVAFKDEHLTFRELDVVTSRFAGYLHAQCGLGTHDLAGIKLDRSIDMQVAIIAIMKAGAAYVPIDVNYPADRLKYIQQNSNYKVCIDEILMAEFKSAAANENEDFQSANVSEDMPAYAIYTSGSTGNPKGVLNDHAGLYNRLCWMRDDLDITESDIILQKTPYTFDVSVWELLMPAVTGCKLVFALPDGHKDPLYLQEVIAAEEVTILHFVPSMLGIFLENLDAEKCTSLRHVVCSGEALPAVMVEDLKEQLPWVRIHNLYGPTEAAIDVTSIDLTDTDTRITGVSIGRPVANTRIYIVNDQLAIQPIGVPGELLIEGVQVARGYLNQPALTTEKFMDSPFRKGQRVYRTGDLAKWLPNGEIAYMGRMDNQVKIRGNRIELGEIETRIMESSFVDQAAVLVMGESAERKYLVAYITPKENYREELLFNYLTSQLPEYMLPARIVELKEFPLTASGKLNRQALPNPGDVDVNASSYEAPRNETEEALAKIWSKVLDLEKPGIHDNFFRTGGDSILSIRLISKINKQFNVAFTIARLYEFNTIARLSELITNGAGISVEEETVRKRIIAGVDHLKATVLKDIANSESIEDVYPMKDIQKGMVLLSAINPVAGMYHDQFAYHVPRMDVHLITRSFEKLVEKHEALRTSFDLTTYQEEVQVVYKSIRFNIEQKDIQSLSQQEQEIYIRDFMAEQRQIPFDTRTAPLWRINLFIISEKTEILLFQFHHAILDGWSVASLYTELFQIYKQLELKMDFQPDALRSSNKVAVIEELFEKNNQQNIEFWKNELKDYQRLNLFTNNQVYKLFSKNYTASFKQQLIKRCAEDKVTLKSVAYGAFVYIMKVLSNENDFVIGSVSNNRPITEDGDKLLGCFLNTTPIRNRLDEFDNLDWSSYFKKTEEKLTAIKGKERTTLYEISKIANERSADNSPFFDVLYNYIDFHIYSGIPLNKQEMSEKTKKKRLSIDGYESTNTALGLSVNLIGNGLTFSYTLNRELKVDITLDKIHECVHQVLSTYIHSPGTLIKDMDLVSEEEKQQLLYTLNDTQKSYSGDQTMFDLFREQAIKTPDLTALVFGHRQLTYKELDEQSNQLAHYLVALGLSKGELVPVFLQRSPELIIGILGIMKAGGAYLPIDTANPTERIHFMLEDSAARFVLTTSKFSSLSASDKITPINIDTIDYQEYPVVTPDVKCNPEDVVYVIYTSGSTGKPKGVLINHGALTSRLRFYKNYYRLAEEDSILFYRSFSFDGAIEEYLLPFTTGARCIVAGPEFKDELFLNMIEHIERYKITKVNMPPILLQDIIEALPNDEVYRIKSLRHIVSGGDKLNVEVVNKFYSKLGEVVHANLYNSYGPTENTIDSTILKLDENIKGNNIPIGKPVENTSVYILDKDNRLLPMGLTGEICVSGTGLANGYLNREELSTEKFISHPFKPGERMYKTGDLGHWLPDGNIAFSGRIDNQVKIRGHRIELGEIEAGILRYEYVENTVVLVREEEDLRKYLIAYVIPKEGYQQELLYSYLREQLPEYMLPGMIIELEVFPVNTNGKLDVKALPVPDERLATGETYVAPGNETETQLVAIWQQLLGLSRVGIHDNFFQIGGDSLTVVKLRHRLQNDFGVQVKLVDLFNNITVQKQALLLQKDLITESDSGITEALRF